MKLLRPRTFIRGHVCEPAWPGAEALGQGTLINGHDLKAFFTGMKLLHPRTYIRGHVCEPAWPGTEALAQGTLINRRDLKVF